MFALFSVPAAVIVVLLSSAATRFSYGQILQFKRPHDEPPGNDVADSGRHDDVTTVTLQIPKRVDVVVKEFDADGDSSGSWYVDHVHAPRYHNREIRTDDYLRLDRGVADVRVVVNYCDCRADACGRGGRRSKTVELAYELYFYVVGGSVYFSTSVSGERIEDGDGYTTDVPENLINRWDTYRNFGPFRRPAQRVPASANDAFNGTRTATGPRVKLLGERTVKEWAAFEVSGDLFKRYVWNQNDGDRRTSGTRADGDVRVTLQPGYVESFDGTECRGLDGKRNVSSDTIVVNRGGCVNAYDGDGCTGSKRIVFQERVRLFSEDGDGRAALPAVKSVATCWQDMTADGMPDARAFGGRRPATVGGDTGRRGPPGRRTACSCGPCPDVSDAAAARFPAAARQRRRATTDARRTVALDAPRIAVVLDELAKWNASAAAATDATLERSVAVITAGTPTAAAAAVAAEAASAAVVVGSMLRTIAVMDHLSAPFHRVNARDRLSRRLLSESVEDTEKFVEQAMKTVPENATYTALNLALSTTCAQAFLSSAVQTITSNLNELAKSTGRPDGVAGPDAAKREKGKRKGEKKTEEKSDRAKRDNPFFYVLLSNIDIHYLD